MAIQTNNSGASSNQQLPSNNTSVMSFPERGPWGKSSWHGNASGYVYKDLFLQYNPKSFIDPMAGSQTSIHVAQEMGIESYGLDLHSGFNAIRHSIRDTVGKEVDMVVSHPPYLGAVRYSLNVWGNGKSHPDDLSECLSDEDFHEKMHLVLLNQREATLPGGIYGALIGDVRSKGSYVSPQAEMISRMPVNELASVIIKTQHNTRTGGKTYGKLKHFLIMHEYLLLWQKPTAPLSLLFDLSEMANKQAARLKSVWKVIVAHAMIALGGKASLEDLYNKIAQSAPEKLSNNDNWKAKIRQTLQLDAKFTSVERGVWALA